MRELHDKENQLVELTLNRWITVNDFMEPEYRALVVEIALEQRDQASIELRKMVNRALAFIVVPGFRSFHKVPVKVAIPYVVKQFQKRREVTLAILSLWSEAQFNLIAELRTLATNNGLFFKTPWTWKEAAQGFYNFDDIPQFHSLVEKLSETKEKPEIDHYMLAELWLSGSLTKEKQLDLDSKEESVSLINNSANGDDSSSNQEKDVPDSEATSEHQEGNENLEPIIHDTSGTHEAQDIEWDELSLRTLIDINSQIQAQIQETQSRMRNTSQSLITCIEDLNISDVDSIIEQIKFIIPDWKSTYSKLEGFDNYCFYRLEKELALRPDIVSIEFKEKPKLEKMIEDFNAILAYEDKKESLVLKIDQLKLEIIKAEQVCSEWNDDLVSNERKNHTTTNDFELADMTLNQLKEMEVQLSNHLSSLSANNLELRSSTINLIKNHLAKLLEIDPAPSKILVDDISLDQIDKIDFTSWGGIKIRRLEKALQTQLNKNILQNHSSKIGEIASSLNKEWNYQDFQELMKTLSVNNRTLEVLLLLLATSLGRENSEQLIIPSAVYTSILKGVNELVGHEKGYELMGRVLPVLLSGYVVEEDERIYELCFAGLALQYLGLLQQKDGLLWQIATEWPVHSMVGWSKVWQSALLGETCPIYSDDSQSDLRRKLDQTKIKVEKVFTKDGAHFYKLSSLRSVRHMTMMDRLLQSMSEKRMELEKFEKVLEKTDPEKLPAKILEISRKIKEEVQEQLNDAKITEMYENGIREDKIIDSNPFHQRTSYGILYECANSLIEFSQTIIDYWNLTLQRMDGIDSNLLRAELEMIPNISEEGKKAVNCVLQTSVSDKLFRVEPNDIDQLNNLIITALLNKPGIVLNLPRVLGHIIETDLKWSTILTFLQQDLGTPQEPSEIASYLLEHKAPNHVLSIVQHIPLDLQNQAQALRSEFEHRCDRLFLEVLQLGGKTDDLFKARELGRWGWLFTELSHKADVLRSKAENERLEVESQIRLYRKSIQELDDQIFDLKAEIPIDVNALLNQGLEIARKSYTNPKLFNALNEFLREVEYRIKHKSWSPTSLRQAVDQLEKELAGVFDNLGITLSVESLLNHLEQNELTPLGLSIDKITPSEIDTRINILKNWIKIRKINNVKGKDLTQSELSSTQALFSYFARMVSMTRFVTENSKSLDTVDPIVYQYWEMRYPRTNALDNQYILMTLPGDPPTPSNMQFIENFIDEKQYLEYYFILLFVPGCTEKTIKRLQHKGLVVIDETRLIEMLIAEANNNNPLGVLRPLVLNAIEANADIFITNQSVNARTSIFLGRDSLIDRLANGGDNYAIYGGRRIGKSSVMKAVEQRLEKRGYRTISLSLEGEKEFGDAFISHRIAQMLYIDTRMKQTNSLKEALVDLLESDPELKLAIFLDEIDRYIQFNSERHTLIETLRSCSDAYGNRFRVIIAGFMSLYDCLHGRGPYSTNSDPWMRMFTDNRELENLTPANAEAIVREGFVSILGWKFENQAIPQRIVERTGGHPAFVQQFCLKLLERVRLRKDQTILLSDVEAVFDDPDPRNSFIAYVRDTFNLNLEPVSNYLILWLSLDASDAQGFTMDNIKNIANQSRVEIPDESIMRSLDILKVTSVIRERMTDVFDFTVPDYPMILDKLGTTAHMDELEKKLQATFNKS